MEELEIIKKICWEEELNNLIKSVSEINVYANKKNIAIKELDYKINTDYKKRKQNDIMKWIFFTELTNNDFLFTPPTIQLYWIKVNLKYLI